MTEPVTLSHRTWTTTEPDEGDRHRYDMYVTYTETVVLRDMTDEEREAMKKARPKPG